MPAVPDVRGWTLGMHIISNCVIHLFFRDYHLVGVIAILQDIYPDMKCSRSVLALLEIWMIPVRSKLLYRLRTSVAPIQSNNLLSEVKLRIVCIYSILVTIRPKNAITLKFVKNVHRTSWIFKEFYLTISYILDSWIKLSAFTDQEWCSESTLRWVAYYGSYFLSVKSDWIVSII